MTLGVLASAPIIPEGMDTNTKLPAKIVKIPTTSKNRVHPQAGVCMPCMAAS